MALDKTSFKHFIELANYCRAIKDMQKRFLREHNTDIDKIRAMTWQDQDKWHAKWQAWLEKQEDKPS